MYNFVNIIFRLSEKDSMVNKLEEQFKKLEKVCGFQKERFEISPNSRVENSIIKLQNSGNRKS